MSEVSTTLEQIKDELKELRVLYEKLIDRLVPEDEPTREEKEALDSSDEIVDEAQMFEALSVHHRDQA